MTEQSEITFKWVIREYGCKDSRQFAGSRHRRSLAGYQAQSL